MATEGPHKIKIAHIGTDPFSDFQHIAHQSDFQKSTAYLIEWCPYVAHVISFLSI